MEGVEDSKSKPHKSGYLSGGKRERNPGVAPAFLSFFDFFII